jgi:hypothetical protein
MSHSSVGKMSWKSRLWKAMIDFWGIALYLTVFFLVFNNYRRLILAHYQISYTEYGVSVVQALVLGKVVLILEELHVGSGFAERPLIIPTLVKTFLFLVCIAIFGLLESLVSGLWHGHGLSGAVHEMLLDFNYERLAGLLVMFFAFVPFFGVRELNRVLGKGTIQKLFFSSRENQNPQT